MRRIVILGSTGSIGENAVKVVKHLDGELSVVGLAAHRRVDRLLEQAAELDCANIALGDATALPPPRAAIHPGEGAGSPRLLAGDDGLLELATLPDADMVLCAITGTAGLLPVLAAIQAGKDIAIASKEILVMAGELIMEAAAQSGSRLLPVDSEHSAIFQCLAGVAAGDVAKLTLTASGGPFRLWDTARMAGATCRDALDHPVWNMGEKVTIDSATMMNKALEIIEARWLFDVTGERIDVLVHPQSIIHSMVELVDGSVLAQLGNPDMRAPIQHALTYPRKLPGSSRSLDLAGISRLTFERPDHQRFPSLGFAYRALREGGTMPAVLNAANEVAVRRFADGEAKLPDIWRIIESTMDAHAALEHPDLKAVIAADQWARTHAAAI